MFAWPSTITMRRSDRNAETPPLPVYIVSSSSYEDGLSLADLVSLIVRRKGLAITAVLICLVPAVFYLFAANPVYQSSIHLLPPRPVAIQSLVVANNGVDIQSYTPQTVYAAFMENLQSPGFRREYFTENVLKKRYSTNKRDAVNADRLFLENFNTNLQVRVDPKNPAFVSVSFFDGEPDFAAQLLNQFVRQVDKRTVEQLIDDTNAAIQSQVGVIQREISGKRLSAEVERQDKILRLQEARSIAVALGIDSVNSVPMLGSAIKGALAINTAQLPLYMRGVDALDAEIATLKSRQSNDPFIDGLRELQGRLSTLRAITIDRGFLAAVTIDDAARPPYQAVSPRYALTLLLAALTGIALSIAMVSIAEIVLVKRRASDIRAVKPDLDDVDVR